MKMTKLFLGFTKSNEVVFAEIENREGRFSASFDTSYPMAIGYDETIERIESLIEQSDSDWVLNRLQNYDCKPSELADAFYNDTYNHVEEFFDNSLYYESYEVEGVDETVYFLASSCGQHDTRNEMGWKVNSELYNYIHELWDEYHLKQIPQDKWTALIEAVEHQNNTLDEEAVIQNWLNKHYGK
jgi:hypothetical protein